MKSPGEMSGLERAAALMVALGPDVASDIVKHLDEESVKKLAVEIAKIDRLTPEEKEDLIADFLLELRRNRGAVSGGENVARDLLVAAFGEEKAKDVLTSFSRKDLEKGFEFLRNIEADILVTFLQDEHPQTITVTLAYLPPVKSAEILKSLNPATAKEVAKRMAKMDRTSPEAVLEIARVLRKKYESYKVSGHGVNSSGGVETLVSILNYISGDQEKMLMDHLEETIPDVSRDIRDRLFTFELILNLSHQEIRILIDEINDDNLIAKALKGAGDELRFKLLRNMSKNRATDVLSEMDSMGPVRVSDIQAARDLIVSIMRSLNDSGVITIRKEKEEYVE